jgi:ribose transport system permease protein
MRHWVAEYLGLTLVLVALVVFFGLTTDYFLTLTTFRTIANQIPDILIVATGMTFVLIIAGVDLSVGSILAFSGAVFGVCLVHLGLPLVVAVAACLGVGLLCGALNGFAVVRWSLPSFIVTLGMLEAARGAAYLSTNSQTMYIGATVEAIDQTQLFGLSIPFLIAVAVVATGQFVLSHTIFGRYVLAIGANEEAARYSGIDTRRIKWSVFALSGLLSAVASIFQVSRLAAADPNAGIGLELQAIAAVVIGGTSLMGGRGSVMTSFFGVLIIAILGTGLIQVGAQDPTKRLVTGCVIVVAVIVDYYRHRLNRSRGGAS